MNADRYLPSRLGLLRNDALGDTLLALPVASAARRINRTIEVELVCAPELVDLMRAHPDLSDVVADPGGDARGLARVLRRRRYEAILVLRPTPRNALAAFLAGIPVRVGTAWRFYGTLFNLRWHGHRRFNERHEIEYNLLLLQRLLGRDPGTPEFYLPPPPAEQEGTLALLADQGIALVRPLVALHPGSSGSALPWPIGHYVELARLLSADGVQVVVSGSADEADLTGQVAAVPGVVDLTGRTTLGQLAWIFKSCDTMVSNSTGPLHLAAAVGTKVVGLYPAAEVNSPVRWGPWGPGHKTFRGPVDDCRRCVGSKCEVYNCLEQVSPEQVRRVAFGIMEQSPHHGRYQPSHSSPEQS